MTWRVAIDYRLSPPKSLLPPFVSRPDRNISCQSADQTLIAPSMHAILLELDHHYPRQPLLYHHQLSADPPTRR
jgi:hypothetical protein